LYSLCVSVIHTDALIRCPNIAHYSCLWLIAEAAGIHQAQ
jgi:hypothetical protein